MLRDRLRKACTRKIPVKLMRGHVQAKMLKLHTVLMIKKNSRSTAGTLPRIIESGSLLLHSRLGVKQDVAGPFAMVH